MEVTATAVPHPLVQNFETTVLTARSVDREIALNRATDLAVKGQINADYVVEFAEKFYAFLTAE